MSSKVDSLIDIHTQRVNEHCARLCEGQLLELKGTQFEDFSRFLQRSWLGFFHHLGMGEDEMLPVICGGAQGNVLELYSALVSLQFTERPVPVAIDNINAELKCCLEWHQLKGDGECKAKDLEFGTFDDPAEQLAHNVNLIARDIFSRWNDESSPVHMVILLCQIIAYHYINGQVYVDTERDLVHPGHEEPVIKVIFTNGLKTSHIYIDLERVWDDWLDFMSRLNGHMDAGEDTENGNSL